MCFRYNSELRHNGQNIQNRLEIFMNKKLIKAGEVSWVVGNILCAIGNCLISKSKFGLSSIIAPAFILHEKIEFLTVGMCEYMIQGILLVLCAILIGRFKAKFTVTICNILFYGTAFDILNFLLQSIQPNEFISKILCAIVGTVLTTLGVAFMLRTYIPPSIYEIFVAEVAKAKSVEVDKMKLIFDTSMLALSLVMMFVLLGGFRLDMLGPFTICTAFLNPFLIGLFGKLLDKYVDFSPAFPALFHMLNHKNADK